jgi:hypothetical protein
MDLNQIGFVIILSACIFILYAVRAICSKQTKEEAFRDFYTSGDSDSAAEDSDGGEELPSEASDLDDDERYDDSE